MRRSARYPCIDFGHGGVTQRYGKRLCRGLSPSSYHQLRKVGVSPNHVPKQESMKASASMWCDSEAAELVRELQKKSFDLCLVRDFVKRNREKQLPVIDNRNEFIRICDLDGTCYMGQTYMLRDWQRLYLPKPTEMAVLGTLESCRSMVPVPQWVILVGEDGRVYAYGEEKIYSVADSLRDLLEFKFSFEGDAYSYPDDISDEDEEELMCDPEIQRIRKSAEEGISEDADAFADFFQYYDLKCQNT